VPFDLKRTAVVLVEYQNDFTSEGGALHDAVRDVMESTGMLHSYGVLKGVVDAGAFVKDEWGAVIVDTLAAQEGDVVVQGKRGLDSFATTTST
jgi:hypothetical protein